MAEEPKTRSRTSYSAQNRHALPGERGRFYDKAGAARDAFGKAHDAQILRAGDVSDPAGAGDPGGEARAAKSCRERLAYCDPHPPYALPAKQAPDENHLKREDFRATRLRNLDIRARRRSRGPSRG